MQTCLAPSAEEFVATIAWPGADEGLTPTKDGGKCLRRLSMFRKEVH